jgi:hypothetical protein
MKTHLSCVFLLSLSLLLCTDKALANKRLDIAMEGPWTFYVQSGFKTTNGTSTVLIAVAPQVQGHLLPVISAGDGGHLPTGINCVVFDTVCVPQTSILTVPPPDGYDDPFPVTLKQPQWKWNQLNQLAYIVILPMPDSWSADGKESLSFQATLPTSSTTVVSNYPGNYAIGIQLHYVNGPDMLDLYSCQNPLDGTSCKQSVYPNNSVGSSGEANSGTLRISMKSDETLGDDRYNCEYHSHGAYRAMLKLVDPTLAYNAGKKYIGMSSYLKNCTDNDPQQGTYPFLSPASSMSHGFDGTSSSMDIPGTLHKLVSYLKESSLPVGELEPQDKQLRGKIPRVSNLTELARNLEQSEDVLSNLLTAYIKKSSSPNENYLRNDESERVGRLQVALLMEQTLESQADFVALSILSGKDCRAAIVLVVQ